MFKDKLTNARNIMNETPPEKMGNFFTWWQQQAELAMARRDSAVVLLPLAGRLWGCALHESPGIMCTKGGTCMIERLINCPNYEQNPDKHLFKTLAGEESVYSCVYCGTELDAQGNPGHLSSVLCQACKDAVLDSFQRSFLVASRALTQEQRRKYLKQ